MKVPQRPIQTARPASASIQQVQEEESASSDTTSPEHEDPETESEPNSSESSSNEDASNGLTAGTGDVERPRKRKRMAEGDDLESAYFKRLQREEDKEAMEKQAEEPDGESEARSDEDLTSSSASDDDSDLESEDVKDAIPRHEVFDKKQNDQDKTTRTVFLGNVSTEAIKSKAARRTLTRHLRSVLKTPDKGKRLGKFESIRFRSTAYTSSSGPKKATFAKKELMDATTTSTNAYAVFTSPAAAEHVAKTLNGTVVLDRHLRVDHLAKPLPVEHKRCVFIGNLSFVNEESNMQDENRQGEDENGSKPKRRQTAKQPADAEEGLWRTFNKVGAVESVRVVRDQETRVSKGFAYVQFKNENSVEAALLLNEKKFPPMLPRKLRVMRAKKTRATVNSKPRQPSSSSSSSRRDGAGKSTFGLKGKDRRNNNTSGSGRGRSIVFEGHRASEGGAKTGKSSGARDGKKERVRKRRPTSSSARRGAQFKRTKTSQGKAGAK